MLEPIDRSELARRLSIAPDEAGLPCWEGVCEMLRQALARWGLSRTSAVTRHVRATLSACGFEGPAVTERVRLAVDLLCSLGDARMVWADARPGDLAGPDEGPGAPTGAVEPLGDGRMVAPTVRRAVNFGDHLLLTGAAEVVDVPLRRSGVLGSPQRAARWIRRTVEVEGALEAQGVEVVRPEAWLGPPSLLDHLERRGARGKAIEGLWTSIVDSFEGGGGPVGDPARVAVLVAGEGQYWGDAKLRTGRWRGVDDAPRGLFLGQITGGYGERAQAIVGEIGAAGVRVMELFDLDELSWATLSRSACEGRREVVVAADDGLQLTCPLPKEAQRVRSICAVSGWRWTPPEFVPVRALGDVVASRFGLLLQE